MGRATPLQLIQKRRLGFVLPIPSYWSPRLWEMELLASFNNFSWRILTSSFFLDVKQSNQHPSEEAVKAKGHDVRKLHVVQMWDQLVMSSGLLKLRFKDKDGKTAMLQWVVPKQQRKEILYHLHGGPMGAHLGESKTLQKLKERFYWPEHTVDVQ